MPRPVREARAGPVRDEGRICVPALVPGPAPGGRPPAGGSFG